MSKDLAASVRARLLNIAKAEQSDFNQVLVRYALERILYRLSQSVYADQFLLKGALLFALWYDMPHRHTRDADLLGFGPSDLESIARTFRDIASVVVEDGIVFDPGSVRVDKIRKEAGYGGARVLIDAEIAKACCKTQIDIGSNDLAVEYGKFGYYFKCDACGSNTTFKIRCGVAGHKERIRKEKLNFYRECHQCATSSVFFTNKG